MEGVQSRFVHTNGIRMHIAEQGEGPLVIMCHGFPESWYSWRHQLPALAAAGFRAVAPDQRGYGGSDIPEAVEAYHILNLVADIVGLVDTFDEEKAIVVGHDWGAPVAWHCALLRPDLFRAVALLSVPYLPRSWGSMRPTEGMRRRFGDKQLYQLYFQEPGRAEQELEENIRETLHKILYSGSGDADPAKRLRFVFEKTEGLLDTGPLPAELPSWLSESDLEFFTKQFEKTGFRGCLNWYRNIDRNWEMSAFLSGAKLRQPTIFIAGEADGVIRLYRSAYDALEDNAPGLVKKVLLPKAGHFVQQERPTEVNDLLISFLKGM